MANGQVTTSGQGSVVKTLSVVLLGLSITASQGAVTGQGSNVSDALTGQASTVSSGSVVPSSSRALTGLQANVSQGAMVATGRSLVQSAQGTSVPSHAVPLVGQVSTTGHGLITPNADGTIPLVGSLMLAESGTVLAPGSHALTGSEVTSESGTVALTLRPTDIAGQEMTGASGVVEIEATNVTVHVTGEEITSAPGLVDATPILTGQAVVSEAGAVDPGVSVDLLGASLFGGVGFVGIGQDPDDTYILSASGRTGIAYDVPLAGLELTSETGTLGITGDVFQDLTGEESASAAGDLAPGLEQFASGLVIVTEMGNFGAPGFGALTGQLVTMGQGTLFVTPDREQALTGQSATVAIGSLLPSPRMLLAGVSGQMSAGELGRSGGDMQQALTGARSTGNTGTVGVIGQEILPPGVSNEGCSIVSAVAAEQHESAAASGAEGCFIQSGTAREV